MKRMKRISSWLLLIARLNEDRTNGTDEVCGSMTQMELLKRINSRLLLVARPTGEGADEADETDFWDS